MSKFIEVTDESGAKNLINVEHIFKIEPKTQGSTVFFIVPLDYKCHYLHISNSYEDIKSMVYPS